MSEVTSVNGHTGAVVLKAADVEAVPTSVEGQPGGVATLDGSGVLSEAQVPSSVALLSAENHFTVGQRIDTMLGMNATGTVRLPINLNPAISGPAAVASGTTDTIGINLNSLAEGDFTGLGGVDPGFVWGFSLFSRVGPNEKDGKGISQYIGANIEGAAQAPDLNIPVFRAAAIRASFYGAAAGGTLGQIESLRVQAPGRFGGAKAGKVTGNVYGLFVEKVEKTTLEAASGFSLYVEGGNSRFGGRVEIANDLSNAGEGDTNIYSGVSNSTTGAVFTLRKEANGGHAVVTLPVASSTFQISNGAETTVKITRGGQIQFGTAADTNLFRNAEKVLKTNNSFVVGETLRHNGTLLGFYNVGEVARGKVEGSRGGNAALASLLAKLAATGIIEDQTTA
jgi:hypothetical protein